MPRRMEDVIGDRGAYGKPSNAKRRQKRKQNIGHMAAEA
jgi:hypothetical protein